MPHITILGGDGYLGWPTAMFFSARGYDVTVVDNYLRRNACNELDVGMLYPVPTLIQRAQIWHELAGKKINVIIGDLKEPVLIREILKGDAEIQWPSNRRSLNSPDVIIHYAEQPSAPYSMLNYKYANITLANNLLVTNNLMFAIKDIAPDIHLIKLGTMGEYGTPEIDIEEGWINIEHKGRKDRFLFPRQASSLYHTTKIMDTDLLWFGVRTWNLRITDLMQGPVYGIETEESKLDQRLDTIFNYDEIFGTILNRFIVQAVAGHPLTIYGKGGQTRGYLNIKDTLQCIEKAVLNTPERGDLKIYNQIMETFSVEELAQKVKIVGNSLKYNVSIEHVKNPRRESEAHYYNPSYQGLIDLGVIPHYLTEEVLAGLFKKVEPYKKNIRKEVIFKGYEW